VILDCDDEYLAGQMMKNSKLAEALEHILRKKPRHIKRELPFRIFVDVQGVRRQRETDLVELARDLSEKVYENKRPIVLNYKSSYDRKIIHMALDKDERVYTKSIGNGPNRKLMILPIRKQDEPEYGDER
jgi:spoIIIJ-associated protein